MCVSVCVVWVLHGRGLAATACEVLKVQYNKHSHSCQLVRAEHDGRLPAGKEKQTKSSSAAAPHDMKKGVMCTAAVAACRGLDKDAQLDSFLQQAQHCGYGAASQRHTTAHNM